VTTVTHKRAFDWHPAASFTDRPRARAADRRAV
jgi:hypothetical protein